MNLLVATDHYLPHGGGSVRVIAETGRRLQARGHRVKVLTFERDPALLDQTPVDGIEVERLPLRGKLVTYPRAFFAGRRAAEAAVRNGGSHLLHIHLPLIGLGAVARNKQAGIPCVCSFYGPWHREMAVELGGKVQCPWARPSYSLYTSLLCRGLAWWQGEVLRRAEKIVVLSEHSRQEIATFFPFIDPSRIVLIPGGVDVERFQPAPDPNAVRQRLDLPQNRTVLFTVRRLVPRMGIENLLHAFTTVREGRDGLYLVIGGSGRLEDDLQRLAGQLGIDDCVRFTGYIPEADLPAYYQAADLFVLPTQALEGFGLITLEALACGLPVLATPAGAIPEIVGRFDARFLAAGTGAAALASGITQGLSLVEREGDALRARCRAFAVANYDWEQIVDRYEALYAQVIGAARGA